MNIYSKNKKNGPVHLDGGPAVDKYADHRSPGFKMRKARCGKVLANVDFTEVEVTCVSCQVRSA